MSFGPRWGKMQDKSFTQTQLAAKMKCLSKKRFPSTADGRALARSRRAFETRSNATAAVSKSILKYSVNACGFVIGENFSPANFYGTVPRYTHSKISWLSAHPSLATAPFAPLPFMFSFFLLLSFSLFAPASCLRDSRPAYLAEMNWFAIVKEIDDASDIRW